MVSIKTATTSTVKPWMPPAQLDYVFTNASIIDPLDGSIRTGMTIALSNGKIKSISAAALPPRANATVLDMSGKYLCPGLIDCHVHLATPPGEDGLAATMSQDPSTALLRQPWLAKQMLHRGFTSIRDCGGATLALKEAIEEGLHPGPRIFLSIHAISQTGGHGDKRTSKDAEFECCGGHTSGIGHIADGVEQCLHAAREKIRQGADFIKIMCSGGVASPTDSLTSTQYTPEEIQAITRVAASSGTYVSAHAYTPQAITNAVENGVKAIEHGNLIDGPTAKLMAERGVILTPTLITYATMASKEFSNFLPSDNAAKNMQVLQAGLRSIQIADAAGVTMCYGTDLLGPLQIRQTGEFALRRRVLSPLKVLQSATVNAAKLVRQEGRLGRIQEGYVADMLVLAANPLDDIEIFDRPEECLLAVIKEGRVMASRCAALPAEA